MTANILVPKTIDLLVKRRAAASLPETNGEAEP